MTIDITPEAVERLINDLWDRMPASLARKTETMGRALSAALTASKTETAAAYERSAQVADYEASQCGPSYGNGYPQKSAWSIASTIRALTTADSKAALDRMIAEARADGMREAAAIANQHMDQRDNEYAQGRDECAKSIHISILAAIPKGTPHE